jgi:hypothetical protein
MRKKLLLSFFILVVAALSTSTALGQCAPGSPCVGVTSNSSDYWVRGYWQNIQAGNFECGASGNVDVLFGSSVAAEDYFRVNTINRTAGDHYHNIGPNRGINYYIRFNRYGEVQRDGCLSCTAGCTKGRTNVEDLGPLYGTTAAIRTPNSLTATQGTYFSKIVLTWAKGSDIPDANIRYRIYRDNTSNLIATVSGGTYAYEDSNRNSSETHTYYISTYTDNSFNPGWGTHESGKVAITGRTYDAQVVATDATLYNRTKITWATLAVHSSGDIEVLRNGTQIAVVNKNSLQYSDYDGVPGVKYQYSVRPIENGVSTYAASDSGASRPNGVINGYVRSKFGSGVKDVIMTVTSTIAGTTYTYLDTTDVSGFYQVKDIFYDTAASYRISPFKGIHSFDPGSVNRTLDLQSNNALQTNFTDTTVYTVAGKATFTDASGCPLRDADLYLNGKYTGKTTNALGEYQLTIEDEGQYDIKIAYRNHQFVDSVISLYVEQDNFGLNFVDIQTDTLIIDLKGGCHNQVASSATFQIVADSSVAGCFNRLVTFNGIDPVVLSLPAQRYRITLQSANNAAGLFDANILNNLDQTNFRVSLISRDTIRDTALVNNYQITQDTFLVTQANDTILVKGDTTLIGQTTLYSQITPNKRADFVSRGKLKIFVGNLPDSVCVNQSGGMNIILEQGVSYPLDIQVKETALFGTTYTDCFIDTGTLRIYDDVSDIGLKQYQIFGGKLRYNLSAGLPEVSVNTANPALNFTKLLQIFATAGTKNTSEFYWPIVIGNRPKTATFTTRAPEFPLMVLHDPPGDASFASFAKDSTYRLKLSNKKSDKFTGGVSGSLRLGFSAKILASFAGIGTITATPSALLAIDGATAGGYDRNNEDSYEISMNFSETISTSNSVNFVGPDADVYVGMSMNVIYATADIVDYDVANCTIVRDTDLIWGMDSINTKFIYTGGFIKNTLIPNLEYNRSITNDTLLKKALTMQINLWNNTLEKNQRRIDSADYIQNVSFSAGVGYDYSMTSTQDSSFLHEYAVIGNGDYAVGGGAADGELFETLIQATLAFETANASGNADSSKTNTTTFTYHLEDISPGDFYSVNIGKDKVYGSPIFKTFAGTSSCPNEPGTQKRDYPDMTIIPNALYSIPVTSPAVFQVSLNNRSESNEARTYNVQIVQESNFDGATIKLGGIPVTQTPASFTVGAGQILTIPMTVEPGPYASDYLNLRLKIQPPCDQNTYQEISDIITKEVPFSVTFQTTCSKIDMYAPSDNWLINSSNNNMMPVVFSNYDRNNPRLIEIGLQYRRTGSYFWTDLPPIAKADLIDPYYTYGFNVSQLPDGPYEIRGYATCGTQLSSKTYTPTLSGIIDRKNLILYGTPSPSDGVLNVGEDIKVTFNKPIDCNEYNEPIQARLTRVDNGAVIPATFTCNGSELIITTQPASLINTLNNVMVSATVDRAYDPSGNKQQAQVKWTFLVNTSPVFWQPSNLHIAATQGGAGTGTGKLKNESSGLQSYTLKKVPSWLIAGTTSGIISQSGGIENINFTLAAGLNPGLYSDTVIANVLNTDQWLFVTAEVVKQAPDWKVDSSKFQYNMNIIANFSSNRSDTALSKDTKDKIAVFKGTECRGTGIIQYVPALNKYAAFITAYSNATVGDTLTFGIWDAQPGVEYQGLEHLIFINDGIIGQPAAPFVVHIGSAVQTKTLSSGWDWFSLNVTSGNMTVANVLKTIEPITGSVVKTQNAFAQYSERTKTWDGTLTSFDNLKSYMINLPKNDTLRFAGNQITDTLIIPVDSGWNWIGYPRFTYSSPAEYLAPFAKASNDIFKSQSQFTTYNGTGWSGSLSFLEPGDGFKLKAGNAVNFHVAPGTRAVPNWNVNVKENELNMGVTAVLQFNGVEMPESHYLIGAFRNGKCISTGQPNYLKSIGGYRIFLSAQGNVADANQPLEFKVYDLDNDIEYTPVYDPANFLPDTTYGLIEQPYVLNVKTATGLNAIKYTDGFSLMQNMPNPFNGNTIIGYKLPVASTVNIQVFDQTGRVIKELVNGREEAGEHSVQFSENELPSGVYYYKMVAGTFSKTRKMTILR